MATLIFRFFFSLCLCFLLCRGCREEERQALLTFKRSLVDEYNLLFDWKSGNCCRWAGVGCSNTTGHVIQLSISSLRNYGDGYPIFSSNHLDPSLGTLKHLQHLDLQYCSFNNTPIPQFIGSLTTLKYLDLSNTDFHGTIPPNLGNLTNLQYLNLSFSYIGTDILKVHLSSLKYLDMSSVDLTNVVDWPLVFRKHPALTVLKLSGCSLQSFPNSASIPHANASSITTLDLSDNYFHGPIPHSLGNLSSLKYLKLSGNHFNDFVPHSLGQLLQLKVLDLSDNSLQGLAPVVDGETRCKGYYNLEQLDLSFNQLSGPLPDCILQMKNLNRLNVGYNNLNGSVLESLGQLLELEHLDVSFNRFQEIVTTAQFTNMTKLETLSLSGNSFVFNICSSWIPPFQLKKLDLYSCRIGPQFPVWLQTQRKLLSLDISTTGISDELPSWFWNSLSGVVYLNISNNHIRGQTPKSLEFLQASYIDLSYNQFHGQLPYINSSVEVVYLNNNSFSGDLQPMLGKALKGFWSIDLSRNNLTGIIPSAICNTSMRMFDLSHNYLSGEIPNCHTSNYFASYINLANNYLSGSIPASIGSSDLEVLILENNNDLHGELPSSLRNCTWLKILGLGGNELTGNIPSWIGESLIRLVFLSLYSNMLTGIIPHELSYLTSLQVLDLSMNELEGAIPSSFNNFTAMSKRNRTEEEFLSISFQLIDIRVGFVAGPALLKRMITVVYKGRKVEFTNTLSLVMILDLSCNRLTGEIPKQVLDLVGLQSLNLSENQLMGKIPDNFGGMRQLEVLDLSWNKLCGEIPESITLLSSINRLNLSYNNLSGRIPSSNQLRTLPDTSSYIGNRDLCGFPLPECLHDKPPSGSEEEDEDNDSDTSDLFLSMGLGYATGLWGICAIFLFKRSWRNVYFRFFDDMADKLYVAKEILRGLILSAIQ